MSRREELLKIYELLNGYFGDLHWWPADEPFEVMVGAILTQNTAWTNVEKAIKAPGLPKGCTNCRARPKKREKSGGCYQSCRAPCQREPISGKEAQEAKVGVRVNLVRVQKHLDRFHGGRGAEVDTPGRE